MAESIAPILYAESALNCGVAARLAKMV